MRSRLEQAHGVDPRDRAAAGADLDHVDHRHLEGQPRALAEATDAPRLELVHAAGPAPIDEAHLRGGAPHVERDEARGVRQETVVAGRHRPRGGARLDQLDGERPGRAHRGDAAVGQHDVELAGQPHRLQPVLETSEIARDPGLDIGVGAGGAGPLVLADLRGDLGRDADRDVRALPLEDSLREALVLRVAVGVHEADGDRLDAVGRQLRGHRAQLGLVEGQDDLALGVDPLADLTPQRPAHEGTRRLELQVVEVVADLAAHLERVAKAARGHVAHPCARALDDRVGDERRAVHQAVELVGIGAGLPEQAREAGKDRLARVVGCGEPLARVDQVPQLVDQDEVGEGPADVDADADPLARHEASTP